MDLIHVDARGLRCPWPVLRLARAMREVAPGGGVRLHADDPAAEGEVRALADTHGWGMTQEAPGVWRVVQGARS